MNSNQITRKITNSSRDPDLLVDFCAGTYEDLGLPAPLCKWLEQAGILQVVDTVEQRKGVLRNQYAPGVYYQAWLDYYLKNRERIRRVHLLQNTTYRPGIVEISLPPRFPSPDPTLPIPSP